MLREEIERIAKEAAAENTALRTKLDALVKAGEAMIEGLDHVDIQNEDNSENGELCLQQFHERRYALASLLAQEKK